MLSRLKRPVIFLLTGITINVATAMTFIWFSRVRDSQARLYAFNETGYESFESFGLTLLCWTGHDWMGALCEPGRLPRWSRLHDVPRPYPLPQSVPVPTELRGWHHEFAAGWPMRALRYDYEYAFSLALRDEWHRHSGIPLPPRKLSGNEAFNLQPRAIPTRIIPTGFALNTLFFTAIASTLWYTPATARSIRRRRHNQCLNCGYSRAGLAADARCPECGADRSSPTSRPTPQPEGLDRE